MGSQKKIKKLIDITNGVKDKSAGETEQDSFMANEAIKTQQASNSKIYNNMMSHRRKSQAMHKSLHTSSGKSVEKTTKTL